MYQRLLALKIITKRNLTETLMRPGFYIAFTISLIICFSLTQGFLGSIGSSGFTPAAHPFYSLVTRFISGAFGAALCTKIFSAGPFLFIIFITFLPFVIYLAISSLYQFINEKNTGALELIVYGPVDATCCLLAAMARNILLTLAYAATLLSFCLVCALTGNLVLGAPFFFSLGILIFSAFAFYGYSALFAVLAENAASAIALFLLLCIGFLLLQAGSLAITTGYLKSLAGIFSNLLQWVSPLFYWNHALDAAEYGNLQVYLSDMLWLVILTTIQLVICHLVLKAKGVHA